MNNRIYHILYGIMVVVVLTMIVWPGTHYEGKSVIEESFPEAMGFSDEWVLEDGTLVDTSALRDLEDTEPYKEFSVFNYIPQGVEEGQYLCFRSKNIFLQVYFDDELVYNPYVSESPLYTKSTGTRWNYIPIHSEDVGKRIEIRVIKVYEEGRASVDNLYIGEPARVIMDTIEGKLVSFITCVLILFVGVILIIVDIPINMRTQKNHELLYLGMFSVSVAIWCLAETHLIQFYYGDSRTMQLVSCCSLMLISIPITLYLDAAFGFRRRKVMMGMVSLSFLSFVATIILHLTRIADVHETLHIWHVVLIMSAIVLLYIIIRNTFVIGKSTSRNVYHILRGVGLCSLSVATIIDIYRYYKGNSNDTAMFVRIGLLVFIVCFGSSSLEKTINAVKLGVQTEIVSQLAYRDGLTRVANRTAFEEHLVELEKRKNDIPAIGIIMFDVNDLKFVNDNFGHQTGDNMLVKSATLIEDAFAGEQGECYRIGGDEFAVVLSGAQVQEYYENRIARFKEIMSKYNAQPDKEFRISIAHGFAVYDKSDEDEMLMNVYQRADVLMYENKKKMKENQIAPEEYYKTGVLM